MTVEVSRSTQIVPCVHYGAILTKISFSP